MTIYDLRNPPKLISHKTRKAGKFLNFHTVEYSQSKSPIMLPRSVELIKNFKKRPLPSIRPLSMTAWICSAGPAVILDKVQAASLTTLVLPCFKRLPKIGKHPAFTTASVWSSLPVTMLPRALQKIQFHVKSRWQEKKSWNIGKRPYIFFFSVKSNSSKARIEFCCHSILRWPYQVA